MITTERMNWFSDTLCKAVEGLPRIVEEMRETATDRERLLDVITEGEQVVSALNLTIGDLRERVALLDQRVHDLLIANAKLERLILTAGDALRASEPFREAASAIAHPLRKVAPGFEDAPEIGYGQ